MVIFEKIKGIIQLMRFDLSFAAGISVVVGEFVAISSFPSLNDLILGFMAGFFISTSALILNDYFDIEADKINRPTRPLPSGIIKPPAVIILWIITSIIGFVVAFQIGYIALLVVILFWIIGFLYNWKFKRMGLFGNLMVSSSVAITFILGGIIVGNPWNAIVWSFAFIAFFINLGEEIASDALDMIGDEKINSKSIAINMGMDNALKISSVLFCIVPFISFIPIFLGFLQWYYLITILFINIIIIFSTFKLLKIQSIDEGRKYTRLIFLGSTFALLFFLIANILA